MGYGLPAAIGAKVARPDKIVVDIDGDASFSMTAMELATAAQYDIGVKVLILNNEFQGMVLQWQGASGPPVWRRVSLIGSDTDLFYEKRYSHTEMKNPNFVKLAEAMGVKAIRCDRLEDLPAKMKEFMEYDNNKPIVFEARVVKNECVRPDLSCSLATLTRRPFRRHVYPMVQAGKALHEQIVHPRQVEMISAEQGAWS
jgi:acetolactate synthase-1/2/3 large subunit